MQDKILNESERINACDEDVRTVTENFQLAYTHKKDLLQVGQLASRSCRQPDFDRTTGQTIYTHTSVDSDRW